jgi:acetyl-CoA carboxylase beta subunit
MLNADRRFKKEQKKNLKAPMTQCKICQEFKYVKYYKPVANWICFDCAHFLDILRKKNYNPSVRGST